MNAIDSSFPDLQVGSPLRFKVLVVDQPGPHREYFAEVLRAVGYNVDAAPDAETTFRKLRSSVRPVDLMIIDLECIRPPVDPLRFLKQLKKQDFFRSTQIIITTDRLLDERLSESSRDLAIHACFNKARPLEELVCLATAIFPPSGHNLRAARRFPVKFLVQYTVGASCDPYYANNLSRGGMFVLKSKPDAADALVELAFTLPESAIPLNATAKVVRAVQPVLDVGTSHYHMFPPGNGIVFLEMATEHRHLLDSFCEREEKRIFGRSAPLDTKSTTKDTCQLTL